MSVREAEKQRQRRAFQKTPRVIPWLEWCKLRGISERTGRRLAGAGKVKVTHLSPRRKGVREDHDREYLDACLRGGA